MITDIMDGHASKIMTLFSISPGSKFTRNEIQEKTSMHNAPLDNALNSLVHNGILEKEKRTIFLNHRNKNAKLIVNILEDEFGRFKELPLKVYYLLMDVSDALSTIPSIEQAYLFGSYAKLIHNEKSDVDLAIVMRKKNRAMIDETKRAIQKIERKYGKIVEGHFFESKDMKQKDPLIKEVLRNNVALF